MRYATIIEKMPNNYSAYVPDLSGCVATAKTIEEASIQIQSAISFHLEDLPIPGQITVCEYIEAA
jgi:predicted RNase H-like HicB family nuclease